MHPAIDFAEQKNGTPHVGLPPPQSSLQLPAELATAAREIQPGQLVGPIELSGGFSILYLIDKRQVLTADPRDAVLSLKQVSITFPAGTDSALASRKANEFAQAMKGATSIGAFFNAHIRDQFAFQRVDRFD